jgi:hypothetical protein
LLELPPEQGAVRQANTDTAVREEVGRGARPAMCLEIGRRADWCLRVAAS